MTRSQRAIKEAQLGGSWTKLNTIDGINVGDSWQSMSGQRYVVTEIVENEDKSRVHISMRAVKDQKLWGRTWVLIPLHFRARMAYVGAFPLQLDQSEPDKGDVVNAPRHIQPDLIRIVTAAVTVQGVPDAELYARTRDVLELEFGTNAITIVVSEG